MGCSQCRENLESGQVILNDNEEQVKNSQLTPLERLNALEKYKKSYCNLCKTYKEATPQEIKLSEKNSVIIDTCQSCKEKTNYSKVEIEMLNALDNFSQNSLYYKIVKEYDNKHRKTVITDRLIILSELVYYENYQQYWEKFLKDEKIKLHLQNLKILKKESHSLMAVDDVQEHCYFAFRGTQLDGSDFLNDLDIAVTGKAHARISQMDDFYDTNKVEYQKKKYSIFVTGHSLGGNVAENILMCNDEVTQCESFNAGNAIDFIPDIFDHFFQNENESTLKNIQKGKTQEELAKELGLSVQQVKKRIEKAKNSDQNLEKDRQEKIISHRIAGDPISISKIYPYSQRFEIISDKKLFEAHSMQNFIDLIDYPQKNQ